MGYIQCCSIPYAPRFIADVAGVNSWTRCSASSSSASFSASQFVFPSYSHMWCDNYGDKWFILISNFMVLGCSSSQKKVVFFCICLLVVSFCDGIMSSPVCYLAESYEKKLLFEYFYIYCYLSHSFPGSYIVFTILSFCYFFPSWKIP